MSSFRAWESWAIYPGDFLIKLQNIFLGLVRRKPTVVTQNICQLILALTFILQQEKEEKKSTFNDDDIDGKPINSETSDNRLLALVADYDDEEDIDGKPISTLSEDIDGRPINPPPEGPFPKHFLLIENHFLFSLFKQLNNVFKRNLKTLLPLLQKLVLFPQNGNRSIRTKSLLKVNFFLSLFLLFVFLSANSPFSCDNLQMGFRSRICSQEQ